MTEACSEEEEQEEEEIQEENMSLTGHIPHQSQTSAKPTDEQRERTISCPFLIRRAFFFVEAEGCKLCMKETTHYRK